MRLISIILVFVSLGVHAQRVIIQAPTPRVHPATGAGCTTYEAEGLWLLNNAVTDEKSNGNVTLSGGAVFQTSPKLEGTHAVSVDGNDRRIDIPTKNYGEGFTCAFGFLKYGISGTVDLFSAYESSDGFELSINMTNSSAVYLSLKTGNGTDVLTASSTTFAMSTGTWYFISFVVDRDGGSVWFYVDGSAKGGGSIRDDFDNNRDAVIGGGYDGSNDAYGYIDVPQIALWEWTATENATAATTPGTEIQKCE